MANFFNNKIIKEDITYIIDNYDFSSMKNSSVLITGATGLIGKHIILLLMYLNYSQSFNIKIYAPVRDMEKANTLFRYFAADNNINFFSWNLTDSLNINGNIDYIIHGANPTSSRFFVDYPVETIKTAFTGTLNMLEIARIKNIKAFVYLSSMEVFGITDPKIKEVRENDYGYIDILNPRSSYSESKRMCECMCSCYAVEYGMPIKIARLAQVLGPGMDYNDTRVTGEFVRSIIENKDIILKTEGKTARPSVYLRDAVSGIFTVLLKGSQGQAYTIANPKTFMTIKDAAEMLASEVAKNKIKVKFNINIPAEYAPNLNLNLNLNPASIEELGWKYSVNLQEAYERIISSFKDII